MDGQTGLKLDDNWEIICPWAQIMIGTSMPAHITENMIELTDEILEKLPAQKKQRIFFNFNLVNFINFF